MIVAALALTAGMAYALYKAASTILWFILAAIAVTFGVSVGYILLVVFFLVVTILYVAHVPAFGVRSNQDRIIR